MFITKIEELESPLERKLIESIKEYQGAITSEIQTVPQAKMLELISSMPAELSIGSIEFWACKDGFLILIENTINHVFKIERKGDFEGMMTEKFDSITSDIFKFYDPITTLHVQGFTVSFGPQVESKFIENLYVFLIQDSENRKMYPKYSKVMFMGRKYIENGHFKPVESASDDILKAMSVMNLKSKGRAEKLVDDYKNLLNNAKSEEEVQKFLNENPVLILPNYEEVMIKPTLSDQYIPDYAFATRRNGRLHWTFVEIENPDKRIFTKQGQFTAQFTQAKNQLLQWDSFISQNILFLKEKFHDLNRPSFYLIYGRNDELDSDNKSIIESEFASNVNRKFSTFDDLALDFKTLLMRLEFTKS